MKVEELINELEKYDGNLEVRTKERYCEGTIPIRIVRKEYLALDDTYIFIG